MPEVSVATLQDVLEAKAIVNMIHFKSVKQKQWVISADYRDNYYFNDFGYSITELKVLFAKYIYMCYEDDCYDLYFNDEYIRIINIKNAQDLYNENSDEDVGEDLIIARIYIDIIIDNNKFKWKLFTMKQNISTAYKIITCYDRRKWPIVAIALYL